MVSAYLDQGKVCRVRPISLGKRSPTSSAKQEFGVNGISGEALLAIVEDRLIGFQSGGYACRENAVALTKVQEAIMWLQKRTLDRMRRGVEGTSVK